MHLSLVLMQLSMRREIYHRASNSEDTSHNNVIVPNCNFYLDQQRYKLVLKKIILMICITLISMLVRNITTMIQLLL